MAYITLQNQFMEVTENLILSYSSGAKSLLIQNSLGDVTNNHVQASASSGGEFGNGTVTLISNEGDINVCEIVSGTL